MHVSPKFLSSHSVENIPDTSPQEAGQYTYQFSPCTPIACKDGGNANGVVSLYCTVSAEINSREFNLVHWRVHRQINSTNVNHGNR